MKKEMIYYIMECCFVEMFCCIDSVGVIVILAIKDIDVSQIIITHYDC